MRYLGRREVISDVVGVFIIMLLLLWLLSSIDQVGAKSLDLVLLNHVEHTSRSCDNYQVIGVFCLYAI